MHTAFSSAALKVTERRLDYQQVFAEVVLDGEKIVFSPHEIF
jgi:hypothetical protein